MRSHTRHFFAFYASFADHFSVTVNYIIYSQIILQIHKVHKIPDDSLFILLIKGYDPGRPEDIFKFQQACVEPPVRIDQTIHTEISVMRIFPMVAAVCVFLLSLNRPAHINSMVTPFPDKSSAELVIFLDQFKIIFQVPRSIPHSMAVFTHDKRLVPLLFKIFMDLGKFWIHSAVEVQIAEIILFIRIPVTGALIMRQPGNIKLFRPGKRSFKCAAISTFISHRPYEHAWPVFIPVYKTLCPVHCSFCKLRVICYGTIPSVRFCLPGIICHIDIRCPVALIICLIYHVEAMSVTELIELRCIWIMAGPDGIYIVLFHQKQIFFHLAGTDNKSCDRVTVVAVDAMEFNILSIDINYPVLHGNVTQPQTVFYDFPLRFQHQAVKIRCLSIPELWIIKFYFYAVRIFILLYSCPDAGICFKLI